MGNLYLIGMMGSGKSTISRLLSKKTNKKFIDTDDYLLKLTSYKNIDEIFENKGEAYFREIEKQALKEVSFKDNYVIATGGGIILDEGNINVMKSTGKVLYLNSSVENLVKNIYNSKGRPLLEDNSLEEQLHKILETRKELYEKASDYKINVVDKSKDEIAKEILDLMVGD